MLWWNWNGRQRLSLLAVMLAVAATPWLLLGWMHDVWGAFLGGTAALLIPQMMAWFIFVGLRTGRIPSAYGGSELRAEEPIWFWFTSALYSGVLLTFFWLLWTVVTE